MGDPKKLKKKYQSPVHPWNKNAIETERKLKNDYGLVNKKEIYIAISFLKKYKDISKKLIADKSTQAEKEKKMIIEKLLRLGLLPVGAPLDQILGLETKDILDRRLQSILFRKGFARSMKQARQFITHRHVLIGNKQITSPSYLLTLEEESQLTFKPTSALASADHPERVVVKAEEIHAEAESVKPKKKTTKKEKTDQSTETAEETEVKEIVKNVEETSA